MKKIALTLACLGILGGTTGAQADTVVKIAFAGPLLANDGQAMRGSLLVIDFADRAAALAWLEHEPFTRAGLYGESQVHAFTNLWPQRAGFVDPMT